MFDLFLFFVYFVYGLAFLVMGLTLALETSRSARTAEGRVLMPLMLFGLLHGFHEWFEAYLIQARQTGMILPEWLPWLRVALLVISFTCLAAYGIRTFQLPSYKPLVGMRLGLLLVVPGMVAILLSAYLAYRTNQIPWAEVVDGLSRYILAIPGALFAALAMRDTSNREKGLGRLFLARRYQVAAFGFAFYGLTQLFVNPLDMFPAQSLNAETFRSLMGFPVQILRAIAAVVITVSVVQATQFIERERQEQLETARKERLHALEQIQAELTKREQLRRELLQHTVFCQEEERSRIARELHDETSQILSALTLDLATLKTMLPGQARGAEIVERLQQLSKQMAQGLYRLVHDLRPAQLDDLGLIPALQYLADQDARGKGLEIALKVEGSKRRLEAPVETVLYRIAQESLTNIFRHARTKQGTITLRYETQQIILSVEDRGIGFDQQKTFLPPRGWGLAGMQERVEAVGGLLSIQSEPGKGTLVQATIPLFDLIP